MDPSLPQEPDDNMLKLHGNSASSWGRKAQIDDTASNGSHMIRCTVQATCSIEAV